jgi:uncharacterized DUF497 family protein
VHDRQFEFQWEEAKAVANARKHGVSFDLARTVFNDPLLLTVADLEHSETEERWLIDRSCHQWLDAFGSLSVVRGSIRNEDSNYLGP